MVKLRSCEDPEIFHVSRDFGFLPNQTRWSSV